MRSPYARLEDWDRWVQYGDTGGKAWRNWGVGEVGRRERGDGEVRGGNGSGSESGLAKMKRWERDWNGASHAVSRSRRTGCGFRREPYRRS